MTRRFGPYGYMSSNLRGVFLSQQNASGPACGRWSQHLVQPSEVKRAPWGSASSGCCSGDQTFARWHGTLSRTTEPFLEVAWLTRLSPQSAVKVGHAKLKNIKHHSLWLYYSFCSHWVEKKHNLFPQTGWGERTFGWHFKAMFNEVRRCIHGVVLRGTCTQAQKCTMAAFWDLDMN
jgi:hypothetical protein